MPRSTTEGSVVAYVGLGANLGDAAAVLHAAFDALAALPGTTLEARSACYRTAPIDALGPDYVNAVARLHTTLAARRLLDALLDIERAHGRERPYPNAPRTLDLDLLLYGDARIDEAGLAVPHPRAHQRAFVLRPLYELAPELVIPGRGPVAALLASVATQRIDTLP